MSKESQHMEEVSVIVPVRDRAEIVCSALDSVKAQTYRPLHLIVVDNASSDATAEVAEAWRSSAMTDDFRVTIVSEPHPGASAARNRGLQVATSRKVMFFDSDDRMCPDLVERAMAAFRMGGKDCRLVFWRHRLTMLDGAVRISHFPGRDILGCHLIHSFLNTSCFLADRELLAEAGGWDASLPAWNDYELGIRLLMRVSGDAARTESCRWGDAVGIDAVLHDMFAQRESITGTRFSEKEGEWEKSLRKVESDVTESGYADKARLLRMLDYRRAVLAAHYRREGNAEGARRLLESVLTDGRNGLWRGMVLRFVYSYTALGLRGAWSIVSVCGALPTLRRFWRRIRKMS